MGEQMVSVGDHWTLRVWLLDLLDGLFGPKLCVRSMKRKVKSVVRQVNENKISIGLQKHVHIVMIMHYTQDDEFTHALTF